MYDVIVIGVGGMGSATVYQLARSGCRVLCARSGVGGEVMSSGLDEEAAQLRHWTGAGDPGHTELSLNNVWR